MHLSITMAAISASMIKAPVASKSVAFKPTSAKKAVFVSNGSIKKTTAFQVWTPNNNKVCFYECGVLRAVDVSCDYGLSIFGFQKAYFGHPIALNIIELV